MKSAKFSKNSELGGQSEFEQLLESSFAYTPPRRGEIRNAIILQIESREIIVDMGAKQDGIVPAQDIERLDSDVKSALVVGGEVPVYVLNPRDQDDNLIVSINMGLQQYDWEKARQLLKSEDVVQVNVTGHNRGGILVRWNRLEGLQENLGIPPHINSFVLTVGATANQNGTALYEGVTVLFLAQVYGIELTAAQQLRVMVMSIVAGIGTAGVPGGSLPMVMIVMQSVGIPVEGMGLILGVDRFLDMCRTMVNVSGDLVIAALVSGRRPQTR